MKNFRTIFYYEWKKIWMSRITLVAFVVLFAFSLLQGVMEVRGNYPDGSIELFQEIDGRTLDDDLLKELHAAADEYGTFWNETNYIYMELCDFVRECVGYGTKISDHDAANVYEMRLDNIDAAKVMSSLSTEEVSYWDAQEESLAKPFVWRNIVVEKELLNSLANVMIMLALFLPLALAGVFASEHSLKTYNILRATKHGRLVVYGAKVLAGSLTALVSFVAFAGGTILTSALYWHLDALDAAVQLAFPFTSLHISVGTLIGIMVVLLFTATLLFAAFSMFFSQVMRHSLAVMGACIGGYFVMFAIATTIPTSARGLSQALSLFPATFVSPRLVYEYRMIPAFGHLLLGYQFAPALYLVVAAFLLVLGGALHRGKRG
jgi:hypothetical protein